ncbi:MAG: threonine synthase [Bacillota bacterium]|nr:threonine synthase [Bacillota bacterium]
MRFISTRQRGEGISAAEAIIKGISWDGGLFVPEIFPELTLDEIKTLSAQPYEKTAAVVTGKYLTDFTDRELIEIAVEAYKGFDTVERAPLIKLRHGEYVLELWHGPTLAFKDMALQMLPHLLCASMKKTGYTGRVLILTATSGDTGKAALEGFAGVKGTAICVFYPKDGVSAAQKLQMCTQEGDNVFVCGVEGNFDDTQTGVKEIFADEAFNRYAMEKGFVLSSANSINFGRLVPQIAYYVWAYSCMASRGAVAWGQKVNFIVPTGNFGNILAAYYAKRMGLPVHKLICASNANNVLTEFFREGRYDCKRAFCRTISPSMDILISSNLERLVFELTGRDTEKVKSMMKELNDKGKYAVGENIRAILADSFWADWVDDAKTKETISKAFKKSGYLMDPHTAVGQAVYERYLDATGDATPSVAVSTASPYKFSPDVLEALCGAKNNNLSESQASRKLSKLSGTNIPDAIANLEKKPVLYRNWCTTCGMKAEVEKFIGRL